MFQFLSIPKVRQFLGYPTVQIDQGFQLFIQYYHLGADLEITQQGG